MMSALQKPLSSFRNLLKNWAKENFQRMNIHVWMSQVHLLVGPPMLHQYEQIKVKVKHLIPYEQDGPHGQGLGVLMMVIQGTCMAVLFYQYGIHPYWGYACIWACLSHAVSCGNTFNDLLLEEPTTACTCLQNNLLLELFHFVVVHSLVRWGLSLISAIFELCEPTATLLLVVLLLRPLEIV